MKKNNFLRTLLLFASISLGSISGFAQATLPVTQNFDSYANVQGAVAINTAVSADGWSFTATNPTDARLQISSAPTAGSAYVLDGTKSLIFSSFSGANAIQILTSPQLPAVDKLLSFKYKSYGSGDKLTIGYGTTNATASATWLSTVYSSTGVNPVNDIEIPAAAQYVFFRYQGNNAYYLALDAISIDTVPSCPKPTSLSPSPTGITWTGAADSYDVVISTTALADPSTGAVNNTPASPYPYSGWVVNANNYVYVRARCGGDVSAWASTTYYYGYCIPAPTSVDNDGMTNVTFGQTQIVNNTTVKEAGVYYHNYTSMVGDAQAGTTLAVSITYKTGYTYGTKIYVDWNNDFDFTDAGENVYTGESLATNPTTLNASFLIPVATPVGSYRMRIVGSDMGDNNPCYSSSYGEVEDYTLNVLAPLPCAAKPTNIHLTSVTDATATISWTAASTAPAVGYEYYISTANTAPSSSEAVVADNVVTDTSVNLSGLSASTTYYVWVRSVCDVDVPETSSWVAVSFTTPCGAFTQLDEHFDSSTFPPTCWSVIYPSTNSYIYPEYTNLLVGTTYTYYGNFGGWIHNNTWFRYLNFNMTADENAALFDAYDTSEGDAAYLITPPLSISCSNSLLKYDVKEFLLNDSYIAGGMKLYIETSTDGVNFTPSTVNVLASISTHNQNATQDWHTFEYDLSAFIGNTVYVRFRGVSDYGGFSLLLDNVVLSSPYIISTATDKLWHFVTYPVDDGVQWGTSDYEFLSMSPKPQTVFKTIKAPAATGQKFGWENVAKGTPFDRGQGVAYAVNNNDGIVLPLEISVNCVDHLDVTLPASIAVGNLGDIHRYAVAGNPYNVPLPFANIKVGGATPSMYSVTGAIGDAFPAIVDRDIALGEGFIVNMNDNADGAAQNLNFTYPSVSGKSSDNSWAKLLKISADPNYTTYLRNYEAGNTVSVTIADWDFFNTGANSTIQLYTLKSERQLAVNTIDNLETEIPLGVFTTFSGNANMTFTGIDTFGSDVYLKDLLKGTETKLSEGSVYNFEVSGSVADRFFITFKPSGSLGIGEVKAGKLTAISQNHAIEIFAPQTLNSVEVYSMNGALVYKSLANSERHITKTLPSGVYVVKATTAKGVESLKVIVK